MTALLIVILVIMLAMLAGWTNSSLKKQSGKLEDADRNIVDLQNRLDALEMQVGTLQSDNQRLQRHLTELGTKVARMKAKTQTTDGADSGNKVNVNPSAGYFGNVISSGSGYFRELMTTPDYTAKFTASKAEAPDTRYFEPLDLNTILSNDGLSLALSVTGETAADDARSFETVSKGIARFDGERWNIVSPCKITFIR